MDNARPFFDCTSVQGTCNGALAVYAKAHLLRATHFYTAFSHVYQPPHKPHRGQNALKRTLIGNKLPSTPTLLGLHGYRAWSSMVRWSVSARVKRGAGRCGTWSLGDR